ncbi:MAG: ABC transporter permease [Clostridiales bacterium]|jgi:ABC-2 type transport system permease protein|nr:ABC transporter permease [Clostridiales bacterium]
MEKLLSKHIVKQSVRDNWKLWAILTGVLCFFIIVMTFAITGRAGGIDGNGISGGGMPGGMMGGSINMENLFVQMFLGSSGIGMLFMLIYSIMTGNKLVASEVDRGTMSFTLNTPTTRKQIVFSKALFYIASIFSMILLLGVSGTVASAIAGATLDYGKLWAVVGGFLLFAFAISGICFAASCWFNKSGGSLLVGAGLPIGFYLLSNFSALITIGDTEILKYISLNTLFDSANIMAGTNFIGQFIALFVIGIALYAVGITKFLKKDLPL